MRHRGERGDVVLSVRKLRTDLPSKSASTFTARFLVLPAYGAGRTELAHALFGIDATEGGTKADGTVAASPPC
jgi:hypothetical protein